MNTRKRRLDPTKTVVALLIALLIAVGFFLQDGGHDQLQPNAQYKDAGPLGAHGLALMLEKLGYQTKLQTEPLQAMPGDAKVWLLIGKDTDFSTNEGTLLLNWVKSGGTLLMGASNFSAGARFSLEKSLGFPAWDNPGNLPYKGRTLPELAPYTLDAVTVYRTGVSKASGSNATFAANTNPKNSIAEIAGNPGGDILGFGYGKGHVIVFHPWLVTNYALVKDDNAVLLSNFVRFHAPSGTVYFDERTAPASAATVQGKPKTFIQKLFSPPYASASWQFLLAALLLMAFVGRRLGSAVPLPTSGPVTRASHFAQAMGALLHKTNRPEAAARIIGAGFRRRLARRLGLSPEEEDAVLAARAHEVAGLPYQLVDRLLLQARAPQGSEAQLLRDAQEMERVLEKLEGKF